MRPPKVPKKMIRPFDSTHLNRMLALCDDSKFLGVRGKAIILTFLDQGLHLNELAKIQISDIYIDRKTIRVRGKGNKERFARIGKATQRALLKYLLMRNDNYTCLWVSEECRPLQPRSIQTMINVSGKRASVDDVRCSPHTFKHTFAAQCLLNGAGEFEVQSLLGHSTLAMTRRYVATLRSESGVIGHRRLSPVGNFKLKRGGTRVLTGSSASHIVSVA